MPYFGRSFRTFLATLTMISPSCKQMTSLAHMTPYSYPKVLSFNSHVVAGSVGHKALLFPLQSLGYNVDYINTVSLSNHPGHRSFYINPASTPGFNDITSTIDTLG